MKARTDDDVIGTRPQRDETADLPLFTPPVQVLGAGQRARQAGRQRSNAASGRATVLRALERAPHGLTRTEIAELTGLPVNTVNGRVSELRDLGAVFTHGTRERAVGGRPTVESVVHFKREAA